MKNKKISCIYTDAGGGHRATALALRALTDNASSLLEIEIVNACREVIPTLDWSRKLSGIFCEDIYNRMILKNDMVRLLPILTGFFLFNTWTMQKRAIKIFTEYFHSIQPQLVLSCLGFINQAVYGGALNYSKNIPFVVLITDFCNSFKNGWIQHKEYYYICGTGLAKQQLLRYGVAPEKIFQTSGMVVHPQFYESQVSNREQARISLGLQPDLLTGLVMFGGYASNKKTKLIIDAFTKNAKTSQLIIVCGNNASLRNQLEQRPTPFNKVVLGYTDNMPYYMQLADFFMGKPGPGSVSEALVSGLPVVIEDNSRVMIQEKPVANWVKENALGWTVDNFSQLTNLLPIIRANLVEYRQCVSKIQNRAVFEVIDILNKLV